MISPVQEKDPIEYPVVCPICDERLKRMNSSHLKKHSLTMEEFVAKYGDHSVKTLRSDPAEYVQRMIQEITGYMARDEELSDEGKATAQELVQNQDAKLRLVLNLMANAEVSELGRLHSSLISIRNVMLDPVRLAEAKDGDLLRIAKHVEGSIERTLNYLKSLSIERKTGVNALFERNVINVFQNDASAPKLPDTPRGREQVGEILRAMLRMASRGEISTSGELVEAEFAVVGQEPNDGNNGHTDNGETAPDAGGT